MTERLLALASVHGGVVTTSLATSVDADEHVLSHLCRSGALVRLRRGAYVLSSAWTDASPEGRLALRTRAVIATQSGWVASHASALVLHDLPLSGVSTSVVDVHGPVQRTRLRSGVRVHPFMPDEPQIDRGGTPCIPLPLALAQVLLRDGRDPVMVPLDAALHRGSLLEHVIEALDRLHPTIRARARAMKHLLASDPKSESPGETRTRLLLLDLGHTVQSQITMCEPSGRMIGRVDFLVDGQVIVEFDGLVKYEGSDGKQALAREKAREDRLRALGYAVVRLTWADLAHPDVVADKIRRAKKLARVTAA